MAFDRLLRNRKPWLILLAAYVTGIMGYGSGLILSASVDLPNGPVIVVSLLISGLLVYNLARAKPKTDMLQ